jgi:integrase/recombinase XerD
MTGLRLAAGRLDACRWAFLARLGSETTRRVYAAALVQFDAWLREQGKGWLDATPEDVNVPFVSFCWRGYPRRRLASG